MNFHYHPGLRDTTPCPWHGQKQARETGVDEPKLCGDVTSDMVASHFCLASKFAFS